MSVDRPSMEMTYDEVAAHAAAITKAQTEDQFVVAFAAYAEEVVARETDPYDTIARFVCGILEGQREAFEARLKSLRSGSAD